MNLIQLAEQGFLPDWAIRVGIRRLLSYRSRRERTLAAEVRRQLVAQFIDQLRDNPLAVNTDRANEQHYEVPADFFRLVLGPHMKYSCCLWPDPSESKARQSPAASPPTASADEGAALSAPCSPEESPLASAERRMLQLTCQRADIRDGMRVLELGCGWGSLTLWMAQQFPSSQVTALSNSHSQRQYIASRCDALGLSNVDVITADICEFETPSQFDRVVSIEMFEHLRNYELLLRRISTWLESDGKLFVHIFCHRDTPYLFRTEGALNWIGRHFFTGGMMPSDDLWRSSVIGVFLDDTMRRRVTPGWSISIVTGAKPAIFSPLWSAAVKRRSSYNAGESSLWLAPNFFAMPGETSGLSRTIDSGNGRE
jgi:cyclopropane-fatty-acyl-phospholipid synthase